MTIQEFLAQAAKGIIPIGALTTIAADRAAFGDDVIAGFRSQAELRSAAAQQVLETATTANRDTLLASEQRAYDGHVRERDSVLSLQQAVERRTEQRAYVPPTQTTGTETRAEPAGAVLAPKQTCREWLERRGGFLYHGEPGVEAVRFGRIVRALALGDRQGLSPLEHRALAEGLDASGGFLVPEVLAGQLIDRVRNAMVVMRAGALTVPMTSETLNIARVGQPDSVSPAIATAAWKAENDLVGETELTLERVQFVARTLPVLCKLSVELGEDAPNVDQAIETELAAQLALELDRAALLGSGAPPEPRGLRNQVGVNVVSYAGVAPTDFDFLIDAIGRVWARNHEPNARITNASLATRIAKFKSAVDSQPLRAPDAVAAVPAYRTNQIPDDGASPETSTLMVGDFSQLLIGMRTSFRLEVSRVSGTAFERLQVWIRAYLRADVQVAHPEAFDITTNVGV